ncbi:MAG: RNA methyltransferase [Candidatus Margulisbacteria bacterium]|nr:RNA methyltransferase [Candidatus Margulisiibacteriota bacterium]
MEIITSLQNEKLKTLQRMHKKQWRDESGLFLIEGKKEISFALRNNFALQSLWVTEKQVSASDELLKFLKKEIPVYQITQELFAKIGYREKTEGIIAVAVKKNHALAGLDIKPHEPGLVLIGDNLEKPGNLGTLFRIADGSGAAAVFLTNQKTDVYNPNVTRNSVGTVFTVPFYLTDISSARTWLQKHNFKIFITTPVASKVFWDIDLHTNVALILGNEHSGVSDGWLEVISEKIRIPMLGQNDSLNLSVSAGILCYEWLRQNQNYVEK